MCVSCSDKTSNDISCLPTDLLSARAGKDLKEPLDYVAPLDRRD